MASSKSAALALVRGNIYLADGGECHQYISSCAAFVKHFCCLLVSVETEECKLFIFSFSEFLLGIGLAYLSCSVENQRFMVLFILPFYEFIIDASFHDLHFF